MKRVSSGKLNDVLGDDFADFIIEMNESGVDFVLVGGYAVGIYGVVRATADIDFLYRRTPENVARLCAALRRFGAPEIVIAPKELLKPEMVSAFGSPPQRIDLLSSISGVDFDTVWAGSSMLTLEDVTLRVIGLEELRKNKKASGRQKDEADLKKLPKPNSPKRHRTP